jgi:hypothetical protein
MKLPSKVGLGIVLACAQLWGQGATAQINGTVRDASGLPVPGTEIKATQTATGAVRTATSDAEGGYVIPNLPIGPYIVEFTKQGFSKYVQSGVVLQVNSGPTVDAALKVGVAQRTNHRGGQRGSGGDPVYWCGYRSGQPEGFGNAPQRAAAH